ncbi:MAG: type II toxin-antitoxin system HicA family toxin [Bacteroidia bacterium]
MSNIPSLTPKELIKILEQKGFVLKRIKGSHHFYHNKLSNKITVVPMHSGTLPKGTFFAILKQAGIDRNEV